jgi:hypothetical protein
MVAQAAGFALLAALSPTALLAAAVYLGSTRPRLTGLFYLTGAVVMSIVMAVVVLVVLHATGLNQRAQHAPRYGLRLGLGLILLGVGLAIAIRKQRPPDPSKPGQGIVSRMVANPAPRSAFGVGVILFLPGGTFRAALQVIATARASLAAIVLAVAVVVVLNVLLIWLPIVFHLIAPAATTRSLTAFNGWLRANGRMVATTAVVVAGAILVVNGGHGLISS